MKKILIFSLAYDPFIGGAEVAIKEITDRIPKEEIEFHMVTARFSRKLPKVEQIGNVLVYRVGMGFENVSAKHTYGPAFYLLKVLYVPLAALKALSLNREHHYAGFWAMMAYMLFPVALLRLFGVKTPYGLTLQEGDPFERVFGRARILFFKPLLYSGFRHARALQTISTYLAEWAIAMGYHGKPAVIPNGVDIALFSKEPSRRKLEELKQSLEKKINSIFLITISRLVHKNGVDLAIKALQHLPQNTSLLIVGEGPEEENLKRLAREYSVMSRVRFLGSVPHQEILPYLKISDVFVRPSRSEGMGNVFIEAMAAGVPVIGTQVGGIKDFLFDPDRNPDIKPTGLAVDPENSREIATQALRYTTDVLLRREVVDNATALVKARYDWKKVVPVIKERFFEKIVS